MLSLSPLLNSSCFSFPIIPQLTHHFHASPFSLKPLSSPTRPLTATKAGPGTSSPTTTFDQQQQQEEEKEEEEDYEVLTATKSEYNNIVILESQNSKILLLDDSGNIHSLVYKTQKWTNSYWDEFSSLPAIIPQGPVAIFGLGGGTVAHQLLHFWPSLIIHGWELDEILVDRARQFFNLSDLENANDSNGYLHICVGDALSSSASVDGGYAAIIVDLFSDAKVLPHLEKAETWVEMRDKLMPNGRIMVNCGGISHNVEVSSVEKGCEVNNTIQALCRALGGHFVNWKKMDENQSGNYLAMTGPLPELEIWSASVPEKLSSGVKLWRSCES